MAADVIEIFLEGARVVATALDDPAVAEAWDRPSVLEEQPVSGLVGHLVWAGAWIVADYLDRGEPDGPADFASAGEYFDTLLSGASPEDHQAIRQRGADVAAAGPAELRRVLAERLDTLGPHLRSLDPSRLVVVTGSKVLRLDDFLSSRIVEQVVHLDDLARSVEHYPWPLPAGASDVALSVGVELAVRRGGTAAMVRALYRRGWAESILPVL